METKVIFSKRLCELRKEKGAEYTRQRVANDLEISRASLEYYEKGQRLPDIEVAAKIADYFEVSTDYLLGRTETKSINEDIQIVCKVTGLSETAATLLKNYNILARKDIICDENGKATIEFAGNEMLCDRLNTLNAILESEQKHGLLLLITEFFSAEFINPFAKESEITDNEFMLERKLKKPPFVCKYVFKTKLIAEALMLKINESLKKLKDELNQKAGD